MKDWAIFPYECCCHDCNHHRVIEKISDKKEELALAKFETYLKEKLK